MIREMEDKDIDTLLTYGKYFWDQTPYVSTGMEYDASTVYDLLNTLKDEHYLRVVEDKEHGIIAFIGFFIHPMMWNPDYLTAGEVFFFVHPDFRKGTTGRTLLTRAEVDLKKMGVQMVSMGEMRSSKDMDDWYAAAGYAFTERTFSKVI